jgi:hypothetical protein
MKLNEAITLGQVGAWQEAQVRMNPGNRSQWFVMLLNSHNKSFILADDDDNPITTDDMNALAELIKSIGLKEYAVFI